MTLLRAFFSLGALTLLSRIFGLARDIVIAAVFGAGAVSDAFFAAFRLPNTLRRFTAEGALTQAFLPAYSRAKKNSREQAAKLAGETAASLGAVLFVVSVVCVAAAPFIIRLIAPGLSESDLAAMLLRVVFPYILFISLVALLQAMLHAHGKFQSPALAPIILNLSMIAAALWAAPFASRPIVALAWSVFVAGALQLAFLIFLAHRAGILPTAVFRLTPTATARRMMIKMLQSAIGAGAAQINLLINLAIASTLAAGSISWLYFADRIMELPAGLLGASLSTVSLTALSANPDSARQFGATMTRALRLCLLLAAPAAAGMAILAWPLVAVLFARGAFDGNDLQMTADAVLAYSIGVIGLVAIRPLAAGFFARQDAMTPVKAAAACLLFTQMLNAIFVWGLGWGHVGIALSIALAANLNAGILWFLLHRRRWLAADSGEAAFIGKVSLATLIMSIILLGLPIFFPGGQDDTWARQAAELLAAVVIGAAVYFLALRLMGVRAAQFRQKIMGE